MKIGFVLDDGLDSPDGVQQNILTLGKWLASQGHQVHYLVGETKRQDIEKLHPVAKNIRVRFNGNTLTIPAMAPKKNIRKILRAENFDVLHVQMPYHPFCAARIVKEADRRTAVVGTFHVLDLGLIMKFGTKLLGLYLHRNLKQFDKFISVSEPARKFARQSFGIDSLVLPNPVEVAKFKPKQAVRRDTRQIRLIFVGRLVPRKGCMKLLEAVERLIADGRTSVNFRVDICGDGLLRASLEAYVKEHNLENIITFHGFVSEQQKVDLLQRADIAVYPSSGGESFGIVLIEAMAAGSGVVLGGDNPGYHSVLAEIPESLFDPHDAKALARSLETYINDKPKRAKLHSQQQELVLKFDVNQVGSRLVEIYRDCIEPKKGQ